MGDLTPPRPIGPDDDTDAFDCGRPALDRWLRDRAVVNESSRASRSYVVCSGGRVVGYYSLAAASVVHSDAPGSVRRNMPDPVPAMLLGRLAVDRQWQGRGLGEDLVRDAILRTLKAARIAGMRAIVVHAIDERAAAFYRRLGFQASPRNPLFLALTLDKAAKACRLQEG